MKPFVLSHNRVGAEFHYPVPTPDLGAVGCAVSLDLHILSQYETWGRRKKTVATCQQEPRQQLRDPQ